MGNTKYIVAVDDQVDNHLILNELLSPVYEVGTLSNGQKSLDYVQSCQPVDLILLDIVMPEMDGFTACKKLKSLNGFADRPVIFLTSLEGFADEQHGLTLGAEDFIHKPLEMPFV